MTDEEVFRHFPVQGWRLKCGLRTDWPKKERRHLYESFGQDLRNKDVHGYVLCDIRVCVRCGHDDAKRVK